MADGKVILIEDMEDDHLLNAHRYMVRKVHEWEKGIRYGYNVLAMLQGEMAIDHTENQIMRAQDKLDKMISKRDTLEAEIADRCLKPSIGWEESYGER